MKSNHIILLASAAASFVFASCANMDPEYQAWKKEQKAKQNNNGNNPYGAPPSQSDVAGVPNGYGVPNNTGITGQAPLQDMPPLPGGGGTVHNPIEVAGGPTMTIPAGGVGAAPAGEVIKHTIVSGDTLWGLAKQYGVSVYDIRIANNLANDTIVLGQTILIPKK